MASNADSKKGDKRPGKEGPEKEPEIDYNALLLEESDAAIRERKIEEQRKMEADKVIEKRKYDDKVAEISEKYFGVRRASPPLTPGMEDDEISFIKEEEEDWDNVGEHSREKWSEADLKELWADQPEKYPKLHPLPGFDPRVVDLRILTTDREDEFSRLKGRRQRKRKPKTRITSRDLGHPKSFYVPYRKHYPTIAWNEPGDLMNKTPGWVLDKLDLEEEFLDWASYVFKDGSTYEGTVFNDRAVGKGVYTTALELCKYEGEWKDNMFSGHGVLSVDVPLRVPAAGSAARKKLKAKGISVTDDFLDPEQRKWLQMELEDLESQAKASPATKRAKGPIQKVPHFEDDRQWMKLYGRKPEKGHYEYAGQFKHNKMHGCGVYKVNGRIHWGKFYFGEFMFDKSECDAKTSAFHAGLATVAASKARMFTQKPDGMVRELKGPYTDPSHPYMYEDDDMWMAPGFINQYHKVPTAWSQYVKEVDEEQQMWLNSFLKAPLRLPMPAELSHEWEKEDEFVVIGATKNVDELMNPKVAKIAFNPKNKGDALLHVPSQQIINWASDTNGHLRFFVQPIPEDGKVDLSKVKVLPLGFEDFLDEDEDEEGTPGRRKKPKTPEQVKAALERKIKRDRKRLDKEREAKWQAEEAQRKQRWAEKDLEARQEAARMKQEEAELEAIRKAELKAKLEAIKLEQERILSGEEEEGEEKDGEVVDPKQEEAAPPPEKSKRLLDDDEDEDDDDKKPRSFGKVACAESDGNGTAGRPGWPAPTVFASITLGSQVAMQRLAASAIGSLREWQKARQVSAAAPLSTGDSGLNATASAPRAEVLSSAVGVRCRPVPALRAAAARRSQVAPRGARLLRGSPAVARAAGALMEGLKGRLAANLKLPDVARSASLGESNIDAPSCRLQSVHRVPKRSASGVCGWERPAVDCLSLAISL